MGDNAMTPREAALEYWNQQPSPRVPTIGGIGQGLRVAVGDLLLVRIVCVAGNQVSYNVRYWLTEAINNQGATLGEIAGQFDAMQAVHWAALMGPNAAYLGTTVQIYRPEPPSAFAYAKDTVLGGALGDTLSKQSCGVVTLFTPLAGVEWRGRIYVPFPAENDNDPLGAPTADYVTRLALLAAGQTTADDFPGSTGSVALTPQLFHRGDEENPEDPEGWTVIVGYRANAKWGTQRRRSDYGKENIAPFSFTPIVERDQAPRVEPIYGMTGGLTKGRPARRYGEARRPSLPAGVAGPPVRIDPTASGRQGT